MRNAIGKLITNYQLLITNEKITHSSLWIGISFQSICTSSRKENPSTSLRVTMHWMLNQIEHDKIL
ncbi:MAG: hypothetical protein HZB41_09340 [Ignavibacteriae bacterium]|nr:hypothetical protein [Ignavibacteriota bacterium]